MRLAVAYEDGNVFQHFGQTSQFKIYEIEEGNVVDAKLLSTQGVGHGAMALALNQLHIEAVICGGIGSGAMSAMKAMEIQVFPGVTGNADDALDAYLAGTLEYDADYNCAEHEEENGFSCSSGGCSSCSSTGCGSNG